MLIAFIDDSKTYKLDWLGIGGFVISADSLQEFDVAFLALLKEVRAPIGNPEHDVEVKWSPDQENWLRKNLDAAARLELNTKLLLLLSKFNAALFASLFNVAAIRAWKEKGQAKDEAHKYLFERLEKYAETKKETLIIVSDSESSHKDSKARLQKCFDLIAGGTDYLKFSRIYRHPWLVDSKFHPGCQLADLIIGITVNMAANNTKHAEQYWPRLQGRFAYLEEMPASLPQRYGLSIMPSMQRSLIVNRLQPYPVTPKMLSILPVANVSIKEEIAKTKLTETIMASVPCLIDIKASPNTVEQVK